MFDLRKHLNKSYIVLEKLENKMEKYHKLCVITKKLHLKKLNQYFANRDLDLAYAAFNLSVKNMELLQFVIENKLCIRAK